MLLAACTDAGPAAQVPADYVGEWRAPGMHLIIGADGTVDYRRVRAATTTRLTAPIRSFDGDDFEVGVGPLATRFQVSVPPHLDGGEWKMTVDGVELTRAAKGTAI